MKMRVLREHELSVILEVISLVSNLFPSQGCLFSACCGGGGQQEDDGCCNAPFGVRPEHEALDVFINVQFFVSINV